MIGLSTRLVLILPMKGSHDLTGAMMDVGSLTMAVSSAGIALSVAERRGKVMSMKEINRPLTLFPRVPPK